jgi:hypothetical protein
LRANRFGGSVDTRRPPPELGAGANPLPRVLFNFLQEMMSGPRYSNNENAKNFLREAEAVIEKKAPDPKS